jgi:hypothetical protein
MATVVNRRHIAYSMHVTISTDERLLRRRTEGEIYQEQRNYRRRLNEERLRRKVQNRKTIFTAVTFVVNVGKTILR